jgi:hypothetical protein
LDYALFLLHSSFLRHGLITLKVDLSPILLFLSYEIVGLHDGLSSLLLLDLLRFCIEKLTCEVESLVSQVIIAGGVFHHAVNRGVAAKSLNLLHLALLLLPLSLSLLKLLLLLLSFPLWIAVLRGLIALDLAHKP